MAASSVLSWCSLSSIQSGEPDAGYQLPPRVDHGGTRRSTLNAAESGQLVSGRSHPEISEWGSVRGTWRWSLIHVENRPWGNPSVGVRRTIFGSSVGVDLVNLSSTQSGEPDAGCQLSPRFDHGGIKKKGSQLEPYFPRYCIFFRWSLSRGYVRAPEKLRISIPTPAPRRKSKLAHGEGWFSLAILRIQRATRYWACHVLLV